MDQLLPQQRIALAIIFAAQALLGIATVFGLSCPEAFHATMLTIIAMFVVFAIAIVIAIVHAERAAQATWYQPHQPQEVVACA